LEITSWLRICNNDAEANEECYNVFEYKPNYMNLALIKIVNYHGFEHMNLDGYLVAISIREADETEILRQSYGGKRLNLSFYDLTRGPGIAIVDDIGAVCRFAEKMGSR
jgi:hypothetical protein